MLGNKLTTHIFGNKLSDDTPAAIHQHPVIAGRALKGVAPVHEGTLVHACAPPPLDWWQPVGTPLQRFAWSIQKA
ncbi:MAG: hypothetical protein FRX49_10763 [Trebouxia sp. A1-2]|nr:MAG: hypothetical protein FRX49_10763 [Trebouxia sp. A1-2]